MKRSWFQDKDGTYFRNLPLIMAEQKAIIGRLWSGRRYRQLEAEWQQAWREGVLRKDHLDRGDKLVQMGRFRDVYPDKPGLWVLDDDSERTTP